MTTAETEPTVEQVLELARRLSPRDQAIIAERLLARLVQVLEPAAPRESLYGALAHLGPAPSAQDIDAARKEMWTGFPREDIA